MTDPKTEETKQLIKAILELRIRPVLQAHGGDITYKDFKDGIVYVEMQGACHGCPNALNTLKENVEGFLKQFFPDEIKAVKDVNLMAAQLYEEDKEAE